MKTCLKLADFGGRNSWFPALHFRSSVQIESRSIFSFAAQSESRETPASPLGQPGLLTIRHALSAPKVRDGVTATALRNGSTYRHGFTETVTVTDTDARKRNAGN